LKFLVIVAVRFVSDPVERHALAPDAPAALPVIE
jgi:hypothetical protein